MPWLTGQKVELLAVNLLRIGVRRPAFIENKLEDRLDAGLGRDAE